MIKTIDGLARYRCMFGNFLKFVYVYHYVFIDVLFLTNRTRLSPGFDSQHNIFRDSLQYGCSGNDPKLSIVLITRLTSLLRECTVCVCLSSIIFSIVLEISECKQSFHNCKQFYIYDYVNSIFCTFICRIWKAPIMFPR